MAPEISEERHSAISSLLKQHHVEASMDFFNVLQQMVTLAPGLRLVYRTNFAGMYNDISQVFVIYYCFLKYIIMMMMILWLWNKTGSLFSQSKIYKTATASIKRNCCNHNQCTPIND